MLNCFTFVLIWIKKCHIKLYLYSLKKLCFILNSNFDFHYDNLVDLVRCILKLLIANQRFTNIRFCCRQKCHILCFYCSKFKYLGYSGYFRIPQKYIIYYLHLSADTLNSIIFEKSVIDISELRKIKIIVLKESFSFFFLDNTTENNFC